MPARRHVVRLLLGAVACLSATPAHADGMRCGTKLVSDGDPLYQVRNICGSPDAQLRRVETRLVRQWMQGPCTPVGGTMRCGYFVEQAVQVVIDEWTYDFGPTNLVRHLTFEQEKLARLTTGGYGTKVE
jgi:hypothetical protein